MDALRRRPSPALQIRLRASRVGLGPWSPDPCFRVAWRETHQRGHVLVGARGLPTASEVAHCLWVLPGAGSGGSPPRAGPLRTVPWASQCPFPLQKLPGPCVKRNISQVWVAAAAALTPWLQASSRGAARSPLPITSHHPHPEPLPKSRLPASLWSKLSAPCGGLWPGLASSGSPRALGDAGRHLRAAGNSLRPALTQLPGRWAPMWPSPSPGSLSTVAARRALPGGVGPQVPPPKARPTEGPGPPSGLLGPPSPQTPTIHPDSQMAQAPYRRVGGRA